MPVAGEHTKPPGPDLGIGPRQGDSLQNRTVAMQIQQPQALCLPGLKPSLETTLLLGHFE
jgi:hypothetical protein